MRCPFCGSTDVADTPTGNRYCLDCERTWHLRQETQLDLDAALRELGTAIAEAWRLPQIADWLTRQINRSKQVTPKGG